MIVALLPNIGGIGVAGARRKSENRAIAG